MANRFAKYAQQPAQDATQGQPSGNRFAKYKAAPERPVIPLAQSAEGKGDRQGPDVRTRNNAAAMGLADSLSMGFGDEIAGGIETIVRKVQGDDRPAGEIYSSFRDKVRAGNEALAQAAPDDFLGGQIMGGVASMGAGLVPGATKAAATLVPKIVQGAKAGAGYGAVYGAGSGEGLEDSLMQAAQGAATGAAVGGLVPAVIAPFSAAGKGARQMVPGKKAAEGFAARQIARAAEREGKTVQQINAELAQIQQSTPDAMVIDALGESGGRLGRAVVNRGGKGARELSKTVYERQLSQNDRITGQIGKQLGDPDSYQKTLDDAIDTLRTNAKPLYEKAYATPINYEKHGPAISRAWSRVPPRLQGAVVSAANDILIAEGKKPKAIGAVIGRGPDGRVTPLPTVEQWDYIKRGLDAVIQAENTKGAAGGMSAIGRSLNDVKKDLLKQIDSAVPEFAAARKVYSDDLSVKNALELGRKSLNTDAEMIAKTMAGLDNASRDTFRIGYARAMAGAIDNMGPGGDAIARLWAAPARQKRLEAVFGSKQRFEQFAEFARREEQMRKSYNAVTGNSTTARQLSDMTDSGLAGAEPLIQAGEQFVRGNVMGAAFSGLRKLVAVSSGMTERRADEIAKILASPSIPQGTLNRAGQYQMSAEQRAILARLVRDTASRSAVLGSTEQ